MQGIDLPDPGTHGIPAPVPDRHGPRSLKEVLPRRPIKPLPGASTSVAEVKCKHCHDTGCFRYDMPVGHPLFGEVFPCPYCNPGRDPQTLHRLSGLFESEQKWRLADIDTEGRPSLRVLRDACRDLIGGKRFMLTVWGSVGIGKTLALQAVVNELAERRVLAQYYTTKQMLDHVRAGYEVTPGEHEPRTLARLESLASVPCLALDEFDKVSEKDWVTEQLTDLIDRRHRGSEAGTHATLIAMNEDPTCLRPWIESRLAAGRNRIVHVEGGDLRPFLGKEEDPGKHGR